MIIISYRYPVANFTDVVNLFTLWTVLIFMLFSTLVPSYICERNYKVKRQQRNLTFKLIYDLN